ncbi:hypothetical protein U1Q18_023385 [Sarracenia purpurea var. burkii]
MAVYVGQKDGNFHRFLVPVMYFNHPLFGELLRDSEEEFGFNHPGGITIPCRVSEFESVQTQLLPAAARRRLLRRPPPPSPPCLSPSHRIVGAYLVSPAHRIVGDLEEEVVNSYTEFLRDLEIANVENVPAPAIAIDYWRLPPESSSKESSKRLYSSACEINILMDSRIFQKFFIQGPPDPQLSGFIFMSPSSPTPSMAHHRQQPAPPSLTSSHRTCAQAAEEDDLGDEVPADNRTEEDEDESGQETKNEVDGAEGDLEVDDEDEEDSSPVIDEVNRSDSGIVLIPDRISSSVKDCNLGEVVKVRLVIDHAGQIDGNIVRTKFTLPERKKVSPPPKVVPTASKREAPKIDNVGADVEKDGPKRQREPSPRRKPHSPLRRRSPVARRGGSPRREIDSPPRRRVNSPVRRRAESPYRRGETPLRRRPASPVRGASLVVAIHVVRKGAAAEGMKVRDYVWRGHDPTSVAVMTEVGKTCLTDCETRKPIYGKLPLELCCEVCSLYSLSVTFPVFIVGMILECEIQLSSTLSLLFVAFVYNRGRAPAAKRGRSSSYSDSPSPRRVCICSAQGIKES